jgi:hypothetical protein
VASQLVASRVVLSSIELVGQSVVELDVKAAVGRLRPLLLLTQDASHSRSRSSVSKTVAVSN